MPLFGGTRDSRFIRGVNNEILQKVIGVEIAVYKIAVADTVSNIYGESDSKVYHHPVRVHALVRKQPTLAINNDTGEIDKNKDIEVAILRDELVALQLVLEISDIVHWDGAYYQVDNVRSSNYWWGRNPDTSIPVAEGDVDPHGYAISVIIECHMVAMSEINLIDVRRGTQPLNRQLPRNL